MSRAPNDENYATSLIDHLITYLQLLEVMFKLDNHEVEN